MPQDLRNRYSMPGTYNDRVVSCMTRYNHPHTHNSTCRAPVPYPTPEAMMARVDAPLGNAWYCDPADDLFLWDFLFHVHMQTAHQIEDQSRRFPNCDMVLDRLIVEGTFDHVAPDSPNIPEEMAMHHSSTMVQWLLMRVEYLESEVSSLTRSRRCSLTRCAWLVVDGTT